MLCLYVVPIFDQAVLVALLLDLDWAQKILSHDENCISSVFFFFTFSWNMKINYFSDQQLINSHLNFEPISKF